MKVAVVFDPEDQKPIYPILELFREMGISASAYKISYRWKDDDQRQLFSYLENSTHIILYTSPFSLEQEWFDFVTGYCVGKRCPTYTFISQPHIHIPWFLRDISACYSIEELRDRFKNAKDEWEQEQRIFLAKEDLINSGFALSDQAMADAVMKGDESATLNFIHVGYTANTRNAEGVPLLALAIRNRNLNLVSMLLKHNADVNTISADRGSTALMDAAVLGDLEIVSMLIEVGADMNIQSKNGQTALMLAVGESKTEIASELIRKGADLTKTDSLGMSALKYAQLFKQEEIVQMIQHSLV